MTSEERVPATAEPPRHEPITSGELAPDFTLPAVDSNGEQSDFTLRDVLANGPLVLVFYQDDGMPVCTRQLKVIAQEFDALTAAGWQVVAINTNGLGSHGKFQERDHFPFALISDFFGDVTKAYGLWDADEGKSRRAVVAISADGLVAYVQPHFNPGNVNAIVDLCVAIGVVPAGV